MQEGYLTEAQQYAQETELSRRVRDWEERIVPVLAQEVNNNLLEKLKVPFVNQFSSVTSTRAELLSSIFFRVNSL